MSHYTRMMIMEAISDQQCRDILNHLDAHAADLKTIMGDGFKHSHRLWEDGGAMIVFETRWKTKADAVKYGTSRSYRLLLEKINHLMIGSPVTKLFQYYEHVELKAQDEAFYEMEY